VDGFDLHLLLGALLLVLAIPAYLAALAQLRRREEDTRAVRVWWFGYARDGVNLAGVVVCCAAFFVGGCPGPTALVLGISLVLVSYLLDWAVGKWLGWRGAIWALAPVLVACGVALLLAPPVRSLTGALIHAVAPR
jgi:hypothetical protein